ncbi:MAG: DUF4097 family beta strand repeat protein [Firmicutes bacterium]|nr:DUF4097 family beta strand repeat protein [Bacillota bacterium]
MNKTQKAILIAVIAIVIGIILLIAAVFAVGGPVRLLDRTLDRFSSHEQVENVEQIAQSGELRGQELKPGDQLQLAGFSEVELNGLVCDVDICSATGPDFSIGLDGFTYDPALQGQYLLICRGKDDQRYSVTEADGKLTITGQGVDRKLSVSKLRDLILNNSRRLVLLVPEDWDGKVTVKAAAGDVDLTDIEVAAADIDLMAGDLDLTDVAAQGDIIVKLSAGDLDLTDVACGELDVNTDLGDVDLTNVACGDLYLNLNAGDLDFTDVACGALDISMNAGDLDLTDVACGKLQVKLDAGDLEFSGLAPDSADIYCRLGDVHGSLKGGPQDYRVDCQVSMGDCHAEDSGSGSRPVSIQVDMGNIDLNYSR